jgi:hypothetical protein
LPAGSDRMLAFATEDRSSGLLPVRSLPFRTRCSKAPRAGEICVNPQVQVRDLLGEINQ